MTGELIVVNLSEQGATVCLHQKKQPRMQCFIKTFWQGGGGGKVKFGEHEGGHVAI